MFDRARYSVLMVRCDSAWKQRLGRIPDRYTVQSVRKTQLKARDAFALADHLNQHLLLEDNRGCWAIVAPPGFLADVTTEECALV